MSISANDALQLQSILRQHQRAEKHIGYHILPERFNALLDAEHRNSYTFFERERFDFFCQHVNFREKRVIDIGCNIGYFLFGALDQGAAQVTGFEGKESCGSFLQAAIRRAGVSERFAFFNEYFRFDAGSMPHDVGILLNVLHHLGDDFGSAPDITAAKQQMLQQLNGLATSIGTLIFQMGFNWQGNRHACLFEQGTKAEMIDFLREGTRAHWNLRAIGVAVRGGNAIRYEILNQNNIRRDDSLGEFLNRPVFILDSKHRP